MLLRLVTGMLARLSTPALMRLGAVLGWVWYRVIPIRRAQARMAVAHAFPEKTRPEREAIVRGNFVHLVRSLLEAMAMIGYDRERLESLVDYSQVVGAVYAAQERKKGTIFCTGHIGSFELLMGAYGFLTHKPLVLIARLPKAGFAREMLEAVRQKSGMEVLTPDGTLERVVSRLKDDYATLGYALDQNMPRHRGLFVEFLGKWCCTTPGFSIIARRSGAEIIPARTERQPDFRHVAFFEGVAPIDPHPHPRVAVLNDTWAMTQRTERWVRGRPEQWFWVHRRWKTQPGPGDIVRTSRGVEVAGEPIPQPAQRVGRRGEAASSVSLGRVGALLDRDGTITVEIGRALVTPDEVKLVPGAAEGIRRLNTAGIAVAVVTNQAVVGRGTIDEAQLEAIHARMRGLLAAEGAHVDAIHFCPHHPTEGVGAYKRECDCRKPHDGLLRAAARELGLYLPASLCVGDRATDVAAARSAGMAGVAVSNGWGHAPWEPVEADQVHPSLTAAVDAFLDRTFGSG